jgi:hypothetical protein
MAAGSIVIDILARTGSFETDTKRAEKRLQELEKTAIAAGKMIAGAFTAATGAAAVLVGSTIRTADEVARLAQLANTSTQSFQKLAFGAQAVGIQQDKLADIFKDVQDKVGDFVQTGGGALADFFENIAPKIGVTVDQFRKLSGPEALQLYVSSLEKANLSQSDMVFYLEAIASDSALLLPLLKDNGAAFAELGDQAERTGAIMGDDLIRASQEFQSNLRLVKAQVDGIGVALAKQLLPTLNVLAQELNRTDAGFKFAEAAGQAFKVILQTVSILAANVAFVFQSVGREIGGIAAQLVAIGRLDFKGASFIGDAMMEDAKRARAELDAFEKRVMGMGGAQTSAVPAAFAPSAPSTSRLSAAPNKKALDEAKKEQEKFDSWMQKNRDAEIKRYFEIQEKRIAEAKKNEEEFQEWMKVIRQGEIDQYLKIQALREEQDKGYWGRWLEAAEEAMTSFQDLAAGVIENFSSGFGNAFEKMVFDASSLKDAVSALAEGMARSIVNALGQMAGQWLAYQAVQAVVGKTAAAGAASAQTLQAMAAQQMAAINAFASTAAIPLIGPALAPAAAGAALAATSPFVATIASLGAAAVGARATGGPVSADAPYLVGERGAELFVPNTSGAIVPNHKLGGGNVTVNLIEDKSRAGKTEERDNNGAKELDIFVSDIMGDGPRSRVMQKAFGLQRRGY